MSLKRVFSLVLALCLCLSMMPNVAVLAEETENVKIFGIDLGVQAGTHMQYTNAYGQKSEDGYYFNGVSLLSTQCLGFARWCQYLLFGYHKAQDESKFYPVTVDGISSVPVGGLNVDILKELVLSSRPGAHLRTNNKPGYNWGHSMVITEITEEGFSIVQCNGDYNNEYSDYKKNYIGTYTYTWETYVSSTYGKWGILYIELPYDYPYSEDHEEHRFTGFYYDTEHPHKVYQRCYCGERLYTEEFTMGTDCEICNPSDSKYDALLPFKAYLRDVDEAYPFTSPQLDALLPGSEIWDEDECIISAIYANGACKVTYPAGATYKTAYLPFFYFLEGEDVTLTTQTVNHQVLTYMHPNTARGELWDSINAGDTVVTVGTKDNMTQFFYQTDEGYQLAWAVTNELRDDYYDSRFAAYGTINGYHCAPANFDAYEADRKTRVGSIWDSDYCTINAIYADGWCQVEFPVGGGMRTGYTKLSNFIYNANASHTRYYATTGVTTYRNQKLSNTAGSLQAGTTFYAVGTYGNATQILYSTGGNYQLAWISNTNFPGVTTYTVSYDPNGGTGAPGSQIKIYDTALQLSAQTPTKEGYLFAGWATKENPDAVQYQPGTAYLTDQDVTLVAVWLSDSSPIISVGSASEYLGKTVTVPVRISQNPGVAGMQLKISYNSDALTLVNVADGGILGAHKFADALTANPYLVSWGGDGVTVDNTANGELLYLTFQIKDNAQIGTWPVTISYADGDIFNAASENITFAVIAGAVTVLKPNGTVLYRTTVNGEETVTYYKRLEEALLAVRSGTLKLLDDVAVSAAFVNPNVTLDLNGKTMTADALVVMKGATVTDGGANCTGGGLLKVAKDNLIFAQNNGQNIIPVWNGSNGYVFTKVTFQQMARTGADGAAQYIFLPRFSNAQAAALMADGGKDNGLNIKVCLTWNGGQCQQFYTYGDDLVKKVFDGTGRWVFDLKITGIAGIADMTASPVTVTDCGTQVTVAGVPVTAG